MIFYQENKKGCFIYSCRSHLEQDDWSWIPSTTHNGHDDHNWDSREPTDPVRSIVPSYCAGNPQAGLYRPQLDWLHLHRGVRLQLSFTWQFLQLRIHDGFLVYGHHAPSLPLPRPGEVLQATLAPHWDGLQCRLDSPVCPGGRIGCCNGPGSLHSSCGKLSLLFLSLKCWALINYLYSSLDSVPWWRMVTMHFSSTKPFNPDKLPKELANRQRFSKQRQLNLSTLEMPWIFIRLFSKVHWKSVARFLLSFSISLFLLLYFYVLGYFKDVFFT